MKVRLDETLSKKTWIESDRKVAFHIMAEGYEALALAPKPHSGDPTMPIYIKIGYLDSSDGTVEIIDGSYQDGHPKTLVEYIPLAKAIMLAFQERELEILKAKAIEADRLAQEALWKD